MDLKQGITIVKNAILTSPSCISSFFNKKLLGFVSEKGYVFYEGLNEDTPIILIHGRNGNVVDFEPLIGNLSNHGWLQPIYGITMGDNALMSVKAEAEIVNSIINGIGCTQCDIIGHSKGGIVAHYLDVMIEKKYKIRKIISAVSPHLGSPLANIVGGQVADDLGTNGSMVEILKPYHTKENYYYVGNVMDHIVSDKSAIPEDVPKERFLRVNSYLGHALLPSIELADKISEWLL